MASVEKIAYFFKKICLQKNMFSKLNDKVPTVYC